jgi:Pentapeptide repeats (8 copies)
MAQQEQASQPQRKEPPPGWRYPDRAKHRSRLRGWLAAIWRGTKDNAALVGLVGVLLTLLVTTVLTQLEGVRQERVAMEVAEQQAQQESLQTYLGDMGELILRDTSPLPEASPDDAVSELARAKTFTVVGGLDGERKGIVIQFLAQTQLIHSGGEKEPIIALDSADLSGAYLRSAYLRDANLSGAYLSNANLSNAQEVTKDQLEQQAATLEGATMPDGSEHP